jgi:RNA polymerase sigma-70 factor (ECF subfamily)
VGRRGGAVESGYSQGRQQRRKAVAATSNPASRVRPGTRQGSEIHDPAENEVDEQTVTAARRGDQEAFVRMLKHYDSRLRALAFRMLRDPTLMDDALQDASIKAYQALPRFRGESEVGTWLYRIAYTTCLDYLRRERRFQLLTCDDALPDPADDDPCDVVTRWLDLEDALDALPVEQRVLVVLVHHCGYDYRTAGEVVGIPEGTVSSRLAAARSRLRGLLAEPALAGRQAR